MHKFIICIIFLFFSENIFAKGLCSFKTANFIEELGNPSSIENILITIPQSKKWVKNGLNILTDTNENILKKYKKNFSGKVKIIYKFGTCDFKADIRQVGDWKDHIKFNNGGNLISSLNIKLLEGNVLNATSFKLLIPETRNNLNEILGTVILKELGFLVPETFITKGEINGMSSLFLFQENIKKEMIERYNRREGPLFEGEEKYLWSYKNHDFFELENISLSRVKNSNWSIRGDSSIDITLRSFTKLQKAYLAYINQNIKDNSLNINPNSINDPLFASYAFSLIALGGTHALRPHNRNYYFNTIEDTFEPIYYDGNFEFEKIDISQMSKSKKNILFQSLPLLNKQFINNFNKILDNKNKKNNIQIKFENRIYKKTPYKFDFKKTIALIKSNLILLSKTNNSELYKLAHTEKYEDLYKNYIRNLELNNLELLVIDEIKRVNANLIVRYKKNGNSKYHVIDNLIDLKDIISNNEFHGSDSVFIPELYIQSTISELKEFSFMNGSIVMSKNIKFEVNYLNKKINITQKHYDDWLLFKNINLEGWDIHFQGSNKFQKINDQRFNKFGITGCLNFYDVNFDDISLTYKNGYCEDAVNIISSKGNIKKIIIENSISDGLDVDFSNVLFDNIEIYNSLNDCADFSFGNYYINKILVTKCGDKGISIGEKSKIEIAKSFVNESSIGISVKDFSQLNLGYLESVKTDICLEAKQKKQEFGGAIILFSENKCDSLNNHDFNSIIKHRVN